MRECREQRRYSKSAHWAATQQSGWREHCRWTARVVTLELDPHHASVARSNFERAGVSDRVELRVGPALQSLAALGAENAGLFDFIFIDADKPNNPHYLSWAMRLSRRGTVIVCDNVIRDGAVVNEDGRDANVEGARAAFSFIGSDKRLEGHRDPDCWRQGL
ncbi:class I SAM-dependent methyltransferase [Mesorhizobium sp. M0184]